MAFCSAIIGVLSFSTVAHSGWLNQLDDILSCVANDLPAHPVLEPSVLCLIFELSSTGYVDPSLHDSCLGLLAENLTRSSVCVVLGVFVHGCLNCRMSLKWHNAFTHTGSSTGQSRLFIKLGGEER